MTIIDQITGSGLTDLFVDENVFATQAVEPFEFFTYNGTKWERTTGGESTVIDDLESTYGITFEGTPTSGDVIAVAYRDLDINVFSPNKGINVEKLNTNFASLQQQANQNEDDILNIANTALLKNGRNLTPEIINDFQSQVPNILSASGSISLVDNTANYLTLTGDAQIVLPVVPSDNYSHTIILIVEGGTHTLDIGTATGGRHLFNDITVDPTETYSVMFVYNKIENAWYYSLTQ